MTGMSTLAAQPTHHPAPRSFYRIWLKAMTAPEEETYREIAASPRAGGFPAFLWAFTTSLAFYAAFFALRLLRLSAGGYTQFRVSLPFAAGLFTRPTQLAPAGWLVVLATAVLLAIVAALALLLLAALVRLASRAFGGRTAFPGTAYTMASIAAPFNLASTLLLGLAAIPLIGVLFSFVWLILGVYAIYLMVLALRSLNGYDWGAAIGSLGIPVLALAVTCACATAGAWALVESALQGAFLV